MMKGEMVSSMTGVVSEQEIACAEKAEISESLRDPSVALGVSQSRVPVWSNKIAHEPSEKALVEDEEAVLKLGRAETALLARDLREKWGANWKRCDSPKIQNSSKIDRLSESFLLYSLKRAYGRRKLWVKVSKNCNKN